MKIMVDLGRIELRPHGCKADFDYVAKICHVLFFSLIRCYFIDGPDFMISQAIWVACVVEPSFASFCPTSMPVEGKFWAMFCGGL